jgi:hypothetical protein
MVDLRLLTVVPILSEWGLIAKVALLGIVGALALRKRLASVDSSK